VAGKREASRNRLEQHMSEEPRIGNNIDDQRLRELEENPDRRMTRAEWEREDSIARAIAHSQIKRPEPAKKKQEGRPDKRTLSRVLPWVIGGLVILALIFFLGFLPRHMREKKAAKLAEERKTEAPEVEVAQVRRTHAPGELTVPGTTAPLVEAYIYARANGYLSKRFVDIGDKVKKGQLLALIDAPDLDQQVEQAREQLNQAEAQVSQQQAQLALNRVTWERWRTLVAKGVFSRQDGDQREADFKAQEAVVASAERNVESFRANLRRLQALQSYERVTAPFDGVITQRNTDVGALVGASGASSAAPMESQQVPSSGSANAGSANTSGTTGTPNQSGSPSSSESQGGALFAIAQYDTLRILVSVPEGYASSLHRGMKAQIYLQEKVGKPIDGLVTRTANSIDQNSRTMLVEVDIDNRKGTIYPGAYTIVSFVEVRGLPPLVIPGDAVVVRDDRTSVAVVKDNKIQMVPVEIGRDYGPSVEILSGLHEGDWVVSTVTDAVQAGIQVKSKPDKQAAQQAAGQSGENTDTTPDYGPDQYGDQSVVDSATESTSQKGKSGQKGQSGQGHKDQKGQSQKQQSKQLEKKGSSQ
jgi:multidrug efflux pump subunit AcrA (membrane-fusion protein)